MAAGRRWTDSRAAHAVVAAALVTALLALFVVAVVQSNSDSRSVTTPGQDGVDFPGRSLPAVAWTGDRLFVFGGLQRSVDENGNDHVTLLNDAALFMPPSVTEPPSTTTATEAPSTTTTELLPAPPFEHPLYVPAAVAVKRQVLVLGPMCATVVQPQEGEAAGCDPGTFAASAFDLETDTWRVVPLPENFPNRGPIGTSIGSITRALGATSDGHAVFALGSTAEEQYWVYAPATDSWSQLAAPGVRSDGSCLANDRVFVMTTKFLHLGEVLDDSPYRNPVPGVPIRGEGTDGYVQATLSVLPLDGSSEWNVSAPLTDVTYNSAPPELTCNGVSVLVADGVDPNKLRKFDVVAGTWSAPAAPPFAYPPGPRISIGDGVVFLPSQFFGDSIAVLDLASNAWRVVQGPSSGVTANAVWTGTNVVGYDEGAAANGRVPVFAFSVAE